MPREVGFAMSCRRERLHHRDLLLRQLRLQLSVLMVSSISSWTPWKQCCVWLQNQDAAMERNDGEGIYVFSPMRNSEGAGRQHRP
jgi:hypothetical protein